MSNAFNHEKKKIIWLAVSEAVFIKHYGRKVSEARRNKPDRQLVILLMNIEKCAHIFHRMKVEEIGIGERRMKSTYIALLPINYQYSCKETRKRYR